jgi:hypothetical protein
MEAIMKLTEFVCLSVVSILLCACDSGSSAPAVSALQIDEEWCKDEVRNNLKDPDSANFKQVHARRAQLKSETYCEGLVNAKNAMGGYVGFKKFEMHKDGSISIRN